MLKLSPRGKLVLEEVAAEMGPGNMVEGSSNGGCEEEVVE